MKYDFDRVISRHDNYAAKYDELKMKFGRDDLIPLWIADMDFMTAAPITDALQKRVVQGIYGYTSRPESYFNSVCNWQKKRNNWEIDRKCISFSPGVVPTLCFLIKEFTCTGDKIIIQPPVYPPFFDAVKNGDREIVLNPLKEENGSYTMDYEDLEAKAKSGAAYLILCNPHNPVGRVWTREELIKLGKICFKHNVKVISDEIHSDLILWDNKHIPFASISDVFAKNTITCISANKTFNLAGLQSSTTIFPNKEQKELYDRILYNLDIARNSCFNLVATQAAYQYGEEWLEQLIEYLQGNIQYINQFCSQHIPQVKPNCPEGTYLVWINFKGVNMNGDQLKEFIIHKARLALNDGRAFGKAGEGYIRLNAACPRSVLEQALNRLKSAIDDLNS